MTQEYSAVDIFEIRAGIGEMLADVAQSGCAQKGIADGVQQHVGIAVAFQPHRVRDFDSADDKFSVFDKLMDVNAYTYAHDSIIAWVMVSDSCGQKIALFSRKREHSTV